MTSAPVVTARSAPPVPVERTRHRSRSEPPEPDWRETASCAQQDLDLFFPVSTVGVVASRQIQAAKQVCAACPVQPACLAWALEVGPEFGIFGGLTEAERRRVRSERRPRPSGRR